MTSELTTIKKAFDELNMTPEQISEVQDLDITAVKAALMQCSSKYRKACGLEEDVDDGLNFTDDQLRRVNEGIFELAMCSEDEHLRFKALSYVRDDKKGRKEIVKAIANGPTFNILQFNEQMRSIRDVTDGIRKKLISV